MADSTIDSTQNSTDPSTDTAIKRLPEEFTYTGTVTDIHHTHSIPFSFTFSNPTSLLSTTTFASQDTATKTELLKIITDLRTTHHDAIFKSYKSSAGSSVSRPCGVCSFENLGRYRRVAIDLYYVFSTASLAERKLVAKTMPVCRDMMGKCRRKAHDSLRNSLEAEVGGGTGSVVFISENVIGPLPGVPVGKLGCELCAKKTVQSMKRCTRCKVARYCDVDCQKRDWKQHKNECKVGALEELKAHAADGSANMILDFFDGKKAPDGPPLIDDAPPAYY